jgi:chemotaxis protein CheD
LTAAGVLQAFGSVTHTLHPGDVACGARGDRLVTLLGSCVAVVMTDPRRSVGAMCHIVHASPREGRHATAAHRDSAWGDVALDVMYEQLRKRGITPQLCEAYVYGGGNMFPGQFSAGHVGDSNARWTLQALAAGRLPDRSTAADTTLAVPPALRVAAARMLERALAPRTARPAGAVTAGA